MTLSIVVLDGRAVQTKGYDRFGRNGPRGFADARDPRIEGGGRDPPLPSALDFSCAYAVAHKYKKLRACRDLTPALMIP